jgi:chromosome segregation ATPase
MGRIGIAYEDIVKAIHECQGLNKNPTVDNIRELLKTGSKSTIARYLREWKTQNGINQTDDTALPSELLQLVKSLWERVKTDADKQIEDYRRESDEEIHQLQEQLAQSNQEKRQLQSQVHQLEENWHRETEKVKHLDSALVAEQQEKAILIERVASQELRHQESQVEMDRLHQLLKHVQTNLEHYQTMAAQLRQEQSLLLEKQQNKYEQKITQLEARLMALTQERNQYQIQFEHTNKDHQELQSSWTGLNHDLMMLKEKHQTLFLSEQKLTQEHGRLMHEFTQQAKNFALFKQTIFDLEVSVKSKDNKIGLLENLLAKTEEKIQSLRHDYEFVSAEKANLEGQFKQLQMMLSNKKSNILASTS